MISLVGFTVAEAAEPVWRKLPREHVKSEKHCWPTALTTMSDVNETICVVMTGPACKTAIVTRASVRKFCIPAMCDPGNAERHLAVYTLAPNRPVPNLPLGLLR